MQTAVTQKLTEAGVLGVIFMVLGPIAVGFSYLSLGSASRSYSGGAPDVGWLFFVAFGGALLTVLSLPLIIVGRRYIVESGAK